MERFQLLCTVSIILIRDGKICLLRRAHTGYYDGAFEVPAGHIDGGEPIRKAAAREAKEEIGIDIKIDDLSVVHVMHRYGAKNERIEFFLIAHAWEGEPRNTEPETADAIGWFGLHQLPEQMVPKCRYALEKYLAGEYFSEYDWEHVV